MKELINYETIQVILGLIIASSAVLLFGAWFIGYGKMFAKKNPVILKKNDLVVYRSGYYEVICRIGDKYNLRSLDKYKTLVLNVERKNIERKVY